MKGKITNSKDKESVAPACLSDVIGHQGQVRYHMVFIERIMCYFQVDVAVRKGNMNMFEPSCASSRSKSGMLISIGCVSMLSIHALFLRFRRWCQLVTKQQIMGELAISTILRQVSFVLLCVSLSKRAKERNPLSSSVLRDL